MKLTSAKLVVSLLVCGLLAGAVAGSVAATVYDNQQDPTLAAGWSEDVPLRLVAKGLIAKDVADGRLSVVAAAAMFYALDTSAVEPPNLVVLDDLGHSPAVRAQNVGERYCRSVLAHVRVALHGRSPEAAEAVLNDLTATYLADRLSQGGIQLPSDENTQPLDAVLARARAVLAALPS